MKMAQPVYKGTGRRKESVAQVRMIAGTGVVTVNNRSLSDYFHRLVLEAAALAPFDVTETVGRYDVKARVSGGGVSAQAGALSLGIARALLVSDENTRVQLRKEGLLTRDAREKERKKYGQKGARARFQFSKR